MRKEDIKGGNKFYLKNAPHIVYEIIETTSKHSGKRLCINIDGKYHAGMALTADGLAMFWTSITLMGVNKSVDSYFLLSEMILMSEDEEEERKLIKKVVQKSEK